MLEINLQQMPTTVDAGAQQQQVINVDCKNVFFEAPHLRDKVQVRDSLYYAKFEVVDQFLCVNHYKIWWFVQIFCQV